MLDKNKLKKSIEAAFLEARGKNDNPEDAIARLSSQIADAIDDYVRSLQITYNTGLTAGPYPVAGVFGYSLS